MVLPKEGEEKGKEKKKNQPTEVSNNCGG